jgi:hypothetical protein
MYDEMVRSQKLDKPIVRGSSVSATGDRFFSLEIFVFYSEIGLEAYICHGGSICIVQERYEVVCRMRYSRAEYSSNVSPCKAHC